MRPNCKNVLFMTCMLLITVFFKAGRFEKTKSDVLLMKEYRGDCAPPEVIVNGSVIPGGGGTNFKGVHEVQFLGIIGPLEQKRVCKIKCFNGTWIGPLCTIDEDGDRFQPMLRQCSLQLTDAEVVVSYKGKRLTIDTEIAVPHGSKLDFRCSEVGMYKFVGQQHLTCSNGQWSSTFPHCVATTLQRNFSVQAPPSIIYNVMSGDADVTGAGEVVILPNSIVHLDCLFQREHGNPEWAWSAGQRQYPCGWSLSTDERSWKYRLSIYYAKEEDSGFYSCTTPRGENNKIYVIVKVVQCPLLTPDSPHLKLSTHNRTYGDRVNFSCPTSYRLVGAASLHCLKNESWSDYPPMCEAIACTPPLPPPNGRVLDTGRYLTGDRVTYTCHAGFVLVGESVAVCNDVGEWTEQPPICKPACEFPGEPANGHIIPTKFHYDIGEIVVVSCNEGFRTLGSKELRCMPSGHWSNPLPHCRPYNR
ncbi:locomotion-related protein Hikaru genki-like [Limulus polyphemus]|uniref:Locomotion-related protein Hikaru genki-like n=1 Tax=Limulus polyphemus TaxID=6850 RepID=A0ABM1SGT7_LIMPO|nr:locomotion-related protein Hikaru genki-like [Limulus polyphemus]